LTSDEIILQAIIVLATLSKLKSNTMDDKWLPLVTQPFGSLSVSIKKGCPLWRTPSPVKDILPDLASQYPDYFKFYCMVFNTDLLHDGQPKEHRFQQQYYRLTTGACSDGDQSFHVLAIVKGDDGDWYNVGYYSNYWHTSWRKGESVRLRLEDRWLTGEEMSRGECWPQQPDEVLIYDPSCAKKDIPPWIEKGNIPLGNDEEDVASWSEKKGATATIVEKDGASSIVKKGAFRSSNCSIQ